MVSWASLQKDPLSRHFLGIQDEEEEEEEEEEEDIYIHVYKLRFFSRFLF
jgi:hypothetical protein